jgi:hypothetical protein
MLDGTVDAATLSLLPVITLSSSLVPPDAAVPRSDGEPMLPVHILKFCAKYVVSDSGNSLPKVWLPLARTPWLPHCHYEEMRMVLVYHCPVYSR